MSGHWFKPKSHGYGAVPANWKGWLATLVYIAGAIAFSLQWFIPTVASGLYAWLGWALGMGILAAVFMLVVRRTTQGQFRGRWGNGRGGTDT